jgi:hypothetical protein
VADLAEALDAALRGRFRVAEVKTPVTQRRGLLARMNQLEKLHSRKGDKPGQAATRAAEAAGIPVRTWRDWRKGTHPPGPKNQRKLERAYVDQITLPAYRKSAKEKGAPSKVNVTAEVWWTDSDKKNNGEYRRVKLTGMKAAMAAVIRAWIAAGPEAAADAFERGCAAVYRVPANEDGTPGIQFQGNRVEIEFP